MSIKLFIIGGAAGSATASARARRVDERAELTKTNRLYVGSSC